MNGHGKKKLVRNYLDEVYAILDAVKLGLGRAALPKHLVRGEKSIRIVSGYKPLKVLLMVQYFRQPYYSKLQKLVIAALRRNIAPSPRISGKS